MNDARPFDLIGKAYEVRIKSYSQSMTPKSLFYLFFKKGRRGKKNWKEIKPTLSQTGFLEEFDFLSQSLSFLP